MQDSAFKGDIVAARVQVRGTGFEPGKAVRVRLLNKKTHLPLKAPDGRDAEKIFTLPDDRTVEEEIPFKADDLGLLEVAAVADLQPGELDDKDNESRRPSGRARRQDQRPVRRWLPALGIPLPEERDDPRQDGQHLLPVDQRRRRVYPGRGPPRARLRAADPRTGETFPGPITRFPETIERVDEVRRRPVRRRRPPPVHRRVSSRWSATSSTKRAAGSGWWPGRGIARSLIAIRRIEAVLPVNITHVLPEDPDADYREGFRPLVTDEGRRGEASTIFRFFADKAVNEKYLREDLQPVFWYCRGISVKPGVGLVYAEHPFDSDPNTGRKAPLLVLGRFGAGRTLFSAIDDTWRWRYYTGESVFDTYWVQQLRYLARSKKLGQRRANFTASRTSYELGDQVTLDLNVMDPALLTQLPPQLRVEIVDEATGQTVRQEALQRQEGSPEHFAVTFVADRVGKFNVRLPAQLDRRPAGRSTPMGRTLK